MESSRSRNRLSFIPDSSSSISAASHVRSRTISPGTSKKLHDRGKLRAVGDRSTSGPPQTVLSRKSNRSESLVPQPPWERQPPTSNSSTPQHLPSRHGTTSNREKRASWSPSVVEPTFPSLSNAGRFGNEGTKRWVQVTERTKPSWPPDDSFLPIPSSSFNVQRTPRAARKVKPQTRADVPPILDRITQQVTVSRSLSWRTHKRGRSTTAVNTLEKETQLSRVNSLPEPVAEKQRIVNVRRARKMQQVFGSEPPQALYQVTHVPPIAEVEKEAIEAFDKRGSVSTLLSLSTANPPSPSPLSSGQQRFSISSTGMGLTPPLTPTTPVLQQPETLGSLLPAFDFANITPLTLPHIPPGDTRETVATSVTRAETTGRRRENDFKQRRIRAAKLSKFFGVGYQDLEPHLAPGEKRSDVRKLEVVIDDGCGPHDRREFRSLEMEDVIVRLRDLRSS